MTKATDAGEFPVTGTGPARAGGFFGALGRMIVRHPWRVIAPWMIAAIAIIATAPALPTTTNESSFLPSSYESIRAASLQDTQAFPQAADVTADAAIIVFSRPGGGKLSPAPTRPRSPRSRPRSTRGTFRTSWPSRRGQSPNKLVQPALVSMNNSVLNGTGVAAGDAIKVLRADIKPLVRGPVCPRASPGRRLSNWTASSPATTPRRSSRSPPSPDPDPAAGHLPQPDHRVPAAGRDRRRLPGRDGLIADVNSALQPELELAPSAPC